MSSISVLRPRTPTENPRYTASPRREELFNLIPKLRAFSHMLCVEPELAETLAQKAFATAWFRQCHMDNPANATTGLFRILHVEFHAHRRMGQTRAAPELDTSRAPGFEDSVPVLAARIAGALARMSDNQREALVLISAGGFSCEDAAAICGAQPKTMKSRAARARSVLNRTLKSDHVAEKSGDVREIRAGAAV
jgi:RNA polymerase sigma-70 factor (ECF subfamily)